MSISYINQATVDLEPVRDGLAARVDLDAVRDGLASAVLSDVLDTLGLRRQCLVTGLRPLQIGSVVAGYAFPVSIVRVNEVPEQPFQGLVRALDAVQPDDVFITPTQGARDIAVWGELLSVASQRRGAAGALTDGLVRDSRAIRELGFPVIAAGTIPYDSMGRHEVTEHRVSCKIGGVCVDVGDLVFGDDDGVVIVPRALAAQVVEGAFVKRSSERMFRTAVADGMLATEAFSRFGVL